MTDRVLAPHAVVSLCAVLSHVQGDNSALHWAAMRGHVEVVRALLAGGADRSVTNKQGLTPVELCQPVWSLSWRFTQEVLSA